MSQISATLIDSMGGDLMVVNAARVSYGAISEKFNERDQALVEFLAKHNHVTPFRHPQVQIRCRAPIFLARQLGKHQTGFSWNELSRRYKDGDSVEVECYIPEQILARPNKLMTETATPLPQDIADDMRMYITNAARSAVREYKALIGFGVAPEQARMVLPQSMITEWGLDWFSVWLGVTLQSAHNTTCST